MVQIDRFVHNQTDFWNRWIGLYIAYCMCMYVFVIVCMCVCW